MTFKTISQDFSAPYKEEILARTYKDAKKHIRELSNDLGCIEAKHARLSYFLNEKFPEFLPGGKLRLEFEKWCEAHPISDEF
jgi:hypothetical protein